MTLDLFIFLSIILDIISVFKGSNASLEMTGSAAPFCHLDQEARGEICHVLLYAQLQRNSQILFIFVPSECQ